MGLKITSYKHTIFVWSCKYTNNEFMELYSVLIYYTGAVLRQGVFK